MPWNETQHPRWPSGAPSSQGGEFRAEEGGGDPTGGTDKQNAYARDVKNAYLENFDRLASTGDSDSATDRKNRSIIKSLRIKPPTSPQEIGQAAAWLRSNTDARWWLDHKDSGMEGLIALYRKTPDAVPWNPDTGQATKFQNWPGKSFATD